MLFYPFHPHTHTYTYVFYTKELYLLFTASHNQGRKLKMNKFSKSFKFKLLDLERRSKTETVISGKRKGDLDN